MAYGDGNHDKTDFAMHAADRRMAVCAEPVHKSDYS